MSPLIEALRDVPSAVRWCRGVRSRGLSLGLVPTMGALHAGHLALVERAAAENERVCASIFVNPLQFDDPRDLERYPRDFEGDARALGSVGCHMVFTGTLAEFFPEVPGAAAGNVPRLDPGPCALGLEGEFRPGHFAGVATICARLFQLVEPDIAYFGEKDFQQTLVVRDLAGRLGGPRIVVCPTVREADGLARSSRNVLLSPEDRGRALALSHALFAARRAWAGGERDRARLEAVLRAELDRPGVEVEYAEVRDGRAWTAGPPRGRPAEPRALVAARVGGVRLIDNLALDAEPGT